MKESNFFTFLSGAILGAAVAILFAPAKGSETREKIRESIENGYDTVKSEIKKRMPSEEEQCDTCESEL